jgi:serine phosphatase RsbU (regulator of sigma subunit)
MDSSTLQPVLTYTGADGTCTVPLDRDSISIGRQADQHIVLPESFVSRRHALINRLDAGYELIDQNSSHGTFVNGEQISRVLLRSGDILQFGSPRALRIRFHSSRPAPVKLQASPSEDLLTAIGRFSGLGDGQRTAAIEIEQLNFLLNAARRLNAGNAKEDILHALLQLSIQLTSVERGFVFLRSGDRLELALGLSCDGTEIKEDSTISRSAMDRAMGSASRFLVSDTHEDLDAGAWASIQANSIRCVYCIPLRKRATDAADNGVLGLLYLDSQVSAGHLTQIDHQLLDNIATEAATLLDNALLAEAELRARQAAQELAVAAKIHAGLMAIDLPTLSYATLMARTIPCHEIGGDFYDAVALDDGLYVVVADVSGKGVSASIVAATLQGIIHAQILAGQPLPQIADLVNRFLCSRSVGKYATMILLRLDHDGHVEYVNCGHIRPLLASLSGVERLDEANLMVGLIADAAYTAAYCQVAPGDRILLATDGVTEAENIAEEPFGDSRFMSAAGLERVDGILDRVTSFLAGNPAQDDCTLLEVEYRGQTKP